MTFLQIQLLSEIVNPSNSKYSIIAELTFCRLQVKILHKNNNLEIKQMLKAKQFRVIESKCRRCRLESKTIEAKKHLKEICSLL